MATTLTTSVFDNLVHEIETAEIKLKLFNSSVSGKEQGCEAKVLEEEINLLKQSVPEGIVGDDGDTGLHYYTAVGELEKEVAELRKLSEITKLSVDSNKQTLENLHQMIQEQREVVSNLEKDVEKETPMEDTGTEEANRLLSDIKSNNAILSELKSSFRDLIDSQMRSESETGPNSCVGLLLQLLWKLFVTSGPAAAVINLSQLQFEVDQEAVEQLVSAGIVTQESDEIIKLVNFACD